MNEKKIPYYQNLSLETLDMAEEVCICRVAEIEQLLKDRQRLAEYEFEKQNRIMARLHGAILQKPDEVEFLLPEINRRYETNLGDGCYQAVMVSVSESGLYSKNSHFLKDVTLLMMNCIKLAKEIIIGQKEPYGLTAFVYYGEEIALQARKNEFEELWNRIMCLKERYGSFQATVSAGLVVKGITEMEKSLKTAAYAQEYRMLTGEQVLCAEEKEEIDRNFNHYLSERRLQELVRFVTLGDVRHVNAWFLEFHEYVEPGFMEYPPAFVKFCWKVYYALAEQGKHMERTIFPERRFFDLQYQFDSLERNRQLEVILLEICHMMRQTGGQDQELANQAIAYMKVHYAEPINLQYMAERCGLSTSYFSRKFKEQTGEKYIDVLTDIRIHEAKRFLGTTDIPVSEIVELVGYCDDKHFRKIFQKIVGMNPLAYRKKIQKLGEELEGK